MGRSKYQANDCMDFGRIGVADERGRQTRTKKEEGAGTSHSLDGTFTSGEEQGLNMSKIAELIGNPN